MVKPNIKNNEIVENRLNSNPKIDVSPIAKIVANIGGINIFTPLFSP